MAFKKGKPRMRKWTSKGLGMTIILLGLTAMLAPPGDAAEPGTSDTVRIGLVSTLFRDTPVALLEPMMRPFKSMMESQTGVKGQMVLARDGEELGKRLDEQQVHFGVFNGFEYAWARQKLPTLKPLVISINQHRHLKAFLVIHRDNDFNGMADLKGKTVALPRFSREHCHLFLDRRCQNCGGPPAEFLGEIAKPQDAEAALDQVSDGSIPAAIIDQLALESYERTKPGWFAYLKIALESELFPPTVVVYKEGTVPEATLKRFRDGLISANQSRSGKSVLGMCKISAFEPIPAGFEKNLDDILKSYPPPASAPK